MLVLFDLDDTLIDHTTAYRSATASLQQAVGFQLPFEELMARWSAAHRRHFDQFLLGNLTYEEQARARVREAIEPSLCDTDADRCFSRYIEAYEQAWSLFPDVEPCLQGLGGHRLGVVSNGQRAQQVSKLVRTGIFDRFECVVVPRDSGCPKPHAGIFLSRVHSRGRTSGKGRVRGDAYDLDAVAARNAGLMGVWLDRTGGAAEQHVPPLIRSLAELPALIDALEAQHCRSGG